MVDLCIIGCILWVLFGVITGGICWIRAFRESPPGIFDSHIDCTWSYFNSDSFVFLLSGDK